MLTIVVADHDGPWSGLVEHQVRPDPSRSRYAWLRGHAHGWPYWQIRFGLHDDAGRGEQIVDSRVSVRASCRDEHQEREYDAQQGKAEPEDTAQHGVLRPVHGWPDRVRVGDYRQTDREGVAPTE